MVRYCYKQIERQQTFEGPLHNNHSEGRTSRKHWRKRHGVYLSRVITPPLSHALLWLITTCHLTCVSQTLLFFDEVQNIIFPMKKKQRVHMCGVIIMFVLSVELITLTHKNMTHRPSKNKATHIYNGQREKTPERTISLSQHTLAIQRTHTHTLT